jgi:hypothetical protein
MNLKDAIASKNVEDKRDPLMREDWWELFRARDPRSNRLDRQFVNQDIQDNRLDKLPSIVEEIIEPDEAVPEFDQEAADAQYQTDFPEFDGEFYKNSQDFIFPEDAINGGAMRGTTMPKGRPQDYHSASGGRPTPTHSDYAGTSGLNQFSANDPMFEQIMGLLAGEEGGVGGDGSINHYDKILNAMKGRDMSPQDILSTLSDGSLRGIDASQMDPLALVEAALADKVNQMMENSGMLPGAKNQSRIGGGDFPRRKSGKGEQKVRRKLKGQADKGDREKDGDRE